jgi:hypothetical protein
MNRPTTQDIEIGRRILHNWCRDNNLAIDPALASDLVQKIAEAIAVRDFEERQALRAALCIFLGHDERFQVAVGGNPVAVEKMLNEARALTRDVCNPKVKQP